MPKISELGEFGLINKLTRLLKTKNPDVVRDFGDDVAFIKNGDSYLLLTVDTLVEGVHFLRRYKGNDVGWKLVSINVSDIAAKGGKPLFALITTALPPDLEVSYIEDIYKGIKEALDFYNFDLVGGNTTSSERICLDMSLLGTARRLIFRDTPQVGDKIYVSGPLGDSRAGLELLLEKKEKYEPYEEELIKKHLRPIARLDLSYAVENFANASMDISDGLVADLSKMLKETSAVLYTENIPISEELKLYCRKRRKNPLDYALHGGEDYQILITSKEDMEPYGFYEIGEITAEGKGVIKDEKGEILKPIGWEHFKKFDNKN